MTTNLAVKLPFVRDLIFSVIGHSDLFPCFFDESKINRRDLWTIHNQILKIAVLLLGIMGFWERYPCILAGHMYSFFGFRCIGDMFRW